MYTDMRPVDHFAQHLTAHLASLPVPFPISDVAKLMDQDSRTAEAVAIRLLAPGAGPEVKLFHGDLVSAARSFHAGLVKDLPAALSPPGLQENFDRWIQGINGDGAFVLLAHGASYFHLFDLALCAAQRPSTRLQVCAFPVDHLEDSSALEIFVAERRRTLAEKVRGIKTSRPLVGLEIDSAALSGLWLKRRERFQDLARFALETFPDLRVVPLLDGRLSLEEHAHLRAAQTLDKNPGLEQQWVDRFQQGLEREKTGIEQTLAQYQSDAVINRLAMKLNFLEWRLLVLRCVTAQIADATLFPSIGILERALAIVRHNLDYFEPDFAFLSEGLDQAAFET